MGIPTQCNPITQYKGFSGSNVVVTKIQAYVPQPSKPLLPSQRCVCNRRPSSGRLKVRPRCCRINCVVCKFLGCCVFNTTLHDDKIVGQVYATWEVSVKFRICTCATQAPVTGVEITHWFFPSQLHEEASDLAFRRSVKHKVCEVDINFGEVDRQISSKKSNEHKTRPTEEATDVGEREHEKHHRHQDRNQAHCSIKHQPSSSSYRKPSIVRNLEAEL